MNSSSREKKFNELKDKVIKSKVQKDIVEKRVTEYNKKISDLEEEIVKLEKMSSIIAACSLEAKIKVIQLIEDITTTSLQYISNANYKFKIEIDDTLKTPKCYFYIVEEIDGVESKQKPEDSCGGGFIDIISTTLRYIYLTLYNNPKLLGPIILDEPGKMISSDMAIKFAEFIKKLGEDFNRQTIMVTHNENLKAIADNEIEVVK